VRVWILRVLCDMLNCLNEDRKLHLLSGRSLRLDPSQLATIKVYLQVPTYTSLSCTDDLTHRSFIYTERAHDAHDLFGVDVAAARQRDSL
jgi:hypothetical protein